MNPRRFSVPGLLLALTAAGCATNEAELQPCPSALVVQPAADVTQFLPGPGRDLTDVIVEAKIQGVDGECEVSIERDGSGEVLVDMTVLFEANRGPANQTRSAQLSYFVALVDQGQNILKKPVFDAEVAFPANGNRVRFADNIAVDIPLAVGEQAASYNILVGFQLTEDEVLYNRSQIR